MDVQLLIGPVELRMGGQHTGILKVAKGGFDFGLSAVSLDDLRRSPLTAIGYQDAKTKIALGEALVFVPIAPHTQWGGTVSLGGDA